MNRSAVVPVLPCVVAEEVRIHAHPWSPVAVLAAALLVLAGCAVTSGTATEPAGDAGAAPGPTRTAAGKTGEPADGRADRPVPKTLVLRRRDPRRSAVRGVGAGGPPGRALVLGSVVRHLRRPGRLGQRTWPTEYGDRLAVLGVAGLGDKAAMDEFVTDLEVGGVTHLNDQAGAVWRRFEVTEQSTFVLIDRAGKVVHKGWLDSVDVDRARRRPRRLTRPAPHRPADHPSFR